MFHSPNPRSNRVIDPHLLNLIALLNETLIFEDGCWMLKTNKQKTQKKQTKNQVLLWAKGTQR